MPFTSRQDEINWMKESGFDAIWPDRLARLEALTDTEWETKVWAAYDRQCERELRLH